MDCLQVLGSRAAVRSPPVPPLTHPPAQPRPHASCICLTDAAPSTASPLTLTLTDRRLLLQQFPFSSPPRRPVLTIPAPSPPPAQTTSEISVSLSTIISPRPPAASTFDTSLRRHHHGRASPTSHFTPHTPAPHPSSTCFHHACEPQPLHSTQQLRTHSPGRTQSPADPHPA